MPRIVRIDIEEAKKLPGVLDIVTGADIAATGWKGAPAMAFFKGVGGSSLRVPFRNGLAVDRVRFVGEPVALIVAKTEAIAQDAAELVAVEYEDLPVYVTADAALAGGATAIHEDAPTNLAFDYEYGNRDSTEPGFKDAAHVVRVALHAQRISGNPMEPKSCTALYDAATETYDICIPTQGISDIESHAVRHGRASAGEIPHHLERRRRRLRRAQRSLSRVSRGHARRQAHRQAGQMARHALGNHLRRSSGARRRPDRRAGARCPRQVSGAARRVAGQSRRVFLERGPADQHGRGTDQLGHEPLQDRRAARPASPGVHQHDADHGLSRCRPSERRVSLGTADRGGGARHRHQSGHAAPAQSSEEGCVPAQDADRLVL